MPFNSLMNKDASNSFAVWPLKSDKILVWINALSFSNPSSSYMNY